MNNSIHKILPILFLIGVGKLALAQPCSVNDTIAVNCYCSDTTQKYCDLLPDITASYDAIADTGGHTEYPQVNAGINAPGQFSDDGRLRLSVALPNVGIGPLEAKAVNYFICGTDTSLGNPGICPDGSQPKGMVVQKIYQKKGDVLSYYYRDAGFMTYHSLHGHFHIDDLSYYTLRIKNPKQPNPLLWPILGKTTKNSFCLIDENICSNYPGYCRDTNNISLADSNFLNFNMSAYWNCGFNLQGISPGAYDEYFKNYWGMWIDIPPGTCNGNYYIVVEVDPLNHLLEITKKNNVIAVPITLTKQVPAGNPIAEISPQGLTTICQGDSLRLTANAGYSYLWSTGDTVQTITVKQAGTYTVTVNSPCGTTTSTPVTVSMISKPSAPSIINDSICKGDSTILYAAGTDSLFWYNNMTSDIIINKGISYHTPPLNQTTTYYVENVKRSPGFTYTTGMPDTIAGGQYKAPYQYMTFDCVSPFTLTAVTVYAIDTTTITVRLYDWEGYLTFSKVAKLMKGKNRIVLDAKIFAGTNFMLNAINDSLLYSSNSNVNYPYTIAGVVSIKNSSMGRNTYSCFYNWEIKTPDFMCSSGRVPVKAYVKSYCTVGINTYNESTVEVKIFPNPFSESTTIKLEGCTPGLIYNFSLFDIFGKEIRFMSARASMGENTLGFTINGNYLSPGIYFYKLFASSTGKQDPHLLYAGKLLVE